MSRFCREDVLLLVSEGVLRFTENGEGHEVCAGEYCIQKHDTCQEGPIPSEAPRYLYVHFLGEWGDARHTLPRRGHFSVGELMPLMQELDALAHGAASYPEKAGVFFRILSVLQRTPPQDTPIKRLKEYIDAEFLSVTSLESLCDRMHYSKNHVVNLFKAEYGVTPFEYINDLKIKRAEHLLETTSDSIDSIARESGFHYYSHFYRMFLRKTGMPPQAWRAKQWLEPKPMG